MDKSGSVIEKRGTRTGGLFAAINGELTVRNSLNVAESFSESANRSAS